MTELAVDVQSVSKRFRLHREKYTSLKERLIHAGHIPYTDLWALRDVCFDVREGETVGILGRNGSGKSTLLKSICGVLKPTSGQVLVRGKLAGLLELGAGFQQELSGRENVYLNGSMLGMSRREVDRVFDAVVEFAELGQFIDNQVKFYSSGMYVRLGFAVAVNVDPDVLVIDEVLAVGDERFQRKCMERIKTFQEEGRTILFVSHSPDQVRSICDRAVVLADGRLVGMGSPGEAVRLFREQLLEAGDVLSAGDPPPAGAAAALQRKAGSAGAGAGEEPEASARHRRTRSSRSSTESGTASSQPVPIGRAVAESRPVRLNDVDVQYPGVTQRPYLVSGQPLAIQVHFDALAPTEGVVFTLEVLNSTDDLFIRTDTDILDALVDVPEGPGVLEFVFDSFPLLDGVYAVNIGIQSRLGGVMFDWREPACRFEVMNPGRATGVVSLPIRVNVLGSDAGPWATPAPAPSVAATVSAMDAAPAVDAAPGSPPAASSHPRRRAE